MSHFDSSDWKNPTHLKNEDSSEESERSQEEVISQI